MNDRYPVVIAGAGVVGLTFALLLARSSAARRLAITVVDAAPPAEDCPDADVDLRVSALSAGSLQLLAASGVAPANDGRSCPYRDMRVWDAGGAPDGPETLHFSAAAFALPALGHIVEDRCMRYQLQRALADCDVSLRFGNGIQTITRVGGAHRVRLAQGDELEAALLVGADGGASAVRRAAGIASDGHAYPQAAVVTHARPRHPHRETAWQRFLDDGPLALLPLADGRVSIVWSTAEDTARSLLDAGDADFSARLSDASDHVLGTLQVEAPRASFPLRAQHARHYVQRGLALIGDAAHTIHPLAGQGANLGIADAAALAAEIERALSHGEHPGDLPVLRRYERGRRGANAAMLHFTDGLNRLFGTQQGWMRTLRGAGLRVFNHSGPLKRRAMLVALGLDVASQP